MRVWPRLACFLLAALAEPPVVIVAHYHKTGSVLARALFDDVAAAVNRTLAVIDARRAGPLAPDALAPLLLARPDGADVIVYPALALDRATAHSGPNPKSLTLYPQ